MSESSRSRIVPSGKAPKWADLLKRVLGLQFPWEGQARYVSEPMMVEASAAWSLASAPARPPGLSFWQFS